MILTIQLLRQTKTIKKGELKKIDSKGRLSGFMVNMSWGRAKGKGASVWGVSSLGDWSKHDRRKGRLGTSTGFGRNMMGSI